MIDKNEKEYGDEIRKRFGDAVIDASNAKLKGMTAMRHAEIERLTEELNKTLAEAFKTGDPAGQPAQRACALHKEWLCCFWPDGAYNPEAHMALAQGYVDDKRFTAYYDNIAPGVHYF